MIIISFEISCAASHFCVFQDYLMNRKGKKYLFSILIKTIILLNPNFWTVV